MLVRVLLVRVAVDVLLLLQVLLLLLLLLLLEARAVVVKLLSAVVVHPACLTTRQSKDEFKREPRQHTHQRSTSKSTLPRPARDVVRSACPRPPLPPGLRGFLQPPPDVDRPRQRGGGSFPGGAQAQTLYVIASYNT